MWTISGPFDGQTAGETSFEKTKLLKTGAKYQLGRKECKLVINHKKVSTRHAEFEVAEFTKADVGNPLIVPNLTLFNTRNKAIAIARGQETVVVNPNASILLCDGDLVSVVSGVPVSVKWQRICCCAQALRGKLSESIEACAPLGINVAHSPDPNVTHHLTSSYVASIAIATSLLSAAHIVKPEWLNEVIRLGNQPHDIDSTALEHELVLPPVTKFRPSFSSSLSSTSKVFKVWEPNEERLNLFKGYRFLIVGEQGREVAVDLRELICRGGGEFEGFSVNAGRVKWRQVLSKGARRVKEMGMGAHGLVAVADRRAMTAAVGLEGFEALVEETLSFGLHFVGSENIVLSVLDVDTSLLRSAAEDINGSTSSSLPDFVPNTHDAEPSIPTVSSDGGRTVSEAASSKRLVRRTTPSLASRAPSVEPIVVDLEPEEKVPPRRTLTRRAKQRPMIIGLDDPSSILDSQPNILAETKTSAASALSPGRPSRLKRRAAADSLALVTSQMFSAGPEEVGTEPPLKRFKALFDASDPARVHGSEGSYGTPSSVAIEDTQSQIFAESQTLSQAQSDARRGVSIRAGLERVVEENEVIQNDLAMEQGKKRKSMNSESEEAVQITDAEAISRPERGPPLKRRAIEHTAVGAIHNNTPDAFNHTRIAPAVSKAGAAPGKPDTDEAFLKALSSTKKGKKNEDSFDREFNNLKISKPELLHEEQQNEWALLEEFGDDSNVRGNFMTIVEISVFRTAAGGGKMSTRPEWQGQPDYKRFKKKDILRSRAVIDLVANQENDYGMGAGYWKTGNSQPQGDVIGGVKRTTFRGNSQNQASPGHEGQADTQIEVGDGPKVTQKNGGTNSRQKPQPLFQEISPSEDEDDDLAGGSDDFKEEDEADTSTLRSSNGKRNQSLTKKVQKAPPAMVIDDSSDDGGGIKGFRAKKRR